MKRCSECEFTFEEHQQFCDFDGTELTVVPEPFPSFKKVSVPATVIPSLFLRVARSRFSVAVLALAGVMLSALLIGYFEAGSQPNIAIASNPESRNEVISVPQGPSASSGQAPEEVAKSRFISTQRTIKADEMPVAPFKKKPPSTSKPEGTKRRFEKTNREFLTRNQKAESQKASQKIVSQKVNSESSAQNLKGPDGSKPQSSKRGDSKVVAILKKTGRILKRPFEF